MNTHKLINVNVHIFPKLYYISASFDRLRNWVLWPITKVIMIMNFVNLCLINDFQLKLQCRCLKCKFNIKFSFWHCNFLFLSLSLSDDFTGCVRSKYLKIVISHGFQSVRSDWNISFWVHTHYIYTVCVALLSAAYNISSSFFDWL